jgi:hypothetical protein
VSKRPGLPRRKEGCNSRSANDNTIMDIKGAQELARLLNERHGAIPDAAPAAALEAADAVPIFHWLGIEPPPSKEKKIS